MGENVEQVTLFGVDNLLHRGQLLPADTLFGETLQELLPGLRHTPEGTQFRLVLEKFREFSKQQFHELLRRHRCPVRVPEGRRHHVLNRALLAVSQLDLDLLPARTGFRPWTSWDRWGGRRGFRARRCRFRRDWLPIPFGVAEVMVRLHEIVDREIVLAVVEPRAASDNLL